MTHRRANRAGSASQRAGAVATDNTGETMKMMKTMIPMKKPSTPNNQHPTSRVGAGAFHWLLDVSRFPFCLAVLLPCWPAGQWPSRKGTDSGTTATATGAGTMATGAGTMATGAGTMATGSGTTEAEQRVQEQRGGNNGFRNNGGGNNVPGPTNYAQFSGFIAVRNIFNPARFAIISNQSRRLDTAGRTGVLAGRHDELRKRDVRVF